MRLYQGTKNGDGFTADEIKRGIHTLYMDVTCPWCKKEQPVAMTGYIGGPCVRCGGRTDGSAAGIGEGARHAS